MPRLYPATPVTGKGNGGVIRATAGAFRQSSFAVTAGMVNCQRETDRKAPPMTIGVVSSAFVSLQRIPCLVVEAFLLFRAARRKPASMTEMKFENGWIGGTGEALASAVTLRRHRLASASGRHRDQRFTCRCRLKIG